MLIADVLEGFWNMCLECYGLDPCLYLTGTGLSWNIMLKMAGIKLNLLTDVDMSQLTEKSIRSGVFYITKR